MELDIFNMIMAFLALAQKDPWGPVTAGAALSLVAFICFKGPLKSRVDRLLKTDMHKRIAVGVAAVLPGVATVLSEHAAWDKALGTALFSFVVSQGIFFLVKPAPAPSSEPESKQ